MTQQLRGICITGCSVRTKAAQDILGKVQGTVLFRFIWSQLSNCLCFTPEDQCYFVCQEFSPTMDLPKSVSDWSRYLSSLYFCLSGPRSQPLPRYRPLLNTWRGRWGGGEGKASTERRSQQSGPGQGGRRGRRAYAQSCTDTTGKDGEQHLHVASLSTCICF